MSSRKHGVTVIGVGSLTFKGHNHLQVQSSLQASNNTVILNTCTRLWLTESEHAIPVVSIKDVVRSSVKVPEFDKHLKKTGGHIDRNVVEIIIKMKTIVRKILMIKIGHCFNGRQISSAKYQFGELIIKIKGIMKSFHKKRGKTSGNFNIIFTLIQMT